MSNVKMRHCMLSANTRKSLRIMSNCVEANVSSRSLIHSLEPLTHSRLLMTIPFHVWTHVKSNGLVFCSSVNAGVGTTSATSTSAISCMPCVIPYFSMTFGYYFLRRCSWSMRSCKASCSCSSIVAISISKILSFVSTLQLWMFVFEPIVCAPPWFPFLQSKTGKGRFRSCILHSLVGLQRFIRFIRMCSASVSFNALSSWSGVVHVCVRLFLKLSLIRNWNWWCMLKFELLFVLLECVLFWYFLWRWFKSRWRCYGSGVRGVWKAIYLLCEEARRIDITLSFLDSTGIHWRCQILSVPLLRMMTLLLARGLRLPREAAIKCSLLSESLPSHMPLAREKSTLATSCLPWALKSTVCPKVRNADHGLLFESSLIWRQSVVVSML